MLTWIITALIVLALVAFPPTRSALVWILDIPGKLFFQWAMFLVMRLFQAHFVVLRNLVMPRAVIFPTLKSEDRVRKD
jgi:hypothetical protein